jgi:hypothetical protein
MRFLTFALLCLLVAAPGMAKEKPPATYRIPLPPKPDFSSLDWLIGRWEGKTTGRGPQGEIHLSVSYDLQKRFMIFREEVELPAVSSVPASKESWLGILGAGPSASDFILRVFSDNGFVTRYRVSVDQAQVLFNPEGGEQPPPGWLFRRVLERVGVSELSATVQVAPPNKPFFDYYTAKLTRVPAPAEEPATPPAPAKPTEE